MSKHAIDAFTKCVALGKVYAVFTYIIKQIKFKKKIIIKDLNGFDKHRFREFNNSHKLA